MIVHPKQLEHTEQVNPIGLFGSLYLPGVGVHYSHCNGEVVNTRVNIFGCSWHYCSARLAEVTVFESRNIFLTAAALVASSAVVRSETKNTGQQKLRLVSFRMLRLRPFDHINDLLQSVHRVCFCVSLYRTQDLINCQRVVPERPMIGQCLQSGWC